MEATVSTPYDQQIEGLFEEYRKARSASAERFRQIQEISATATAPRQSVKVTVGVRGDITALEFPTGAYRRMAPAELSQAILAAIQEARAKALAQLSDMDLGGVLSAMNPTDLLQGKVDPAAVLPEDPFALKGLGDALGTERRS
ncbi:YbaB/EbfC family nucleoid-associated protein [Streptomyces mirabilis]|uniref:YbaB/EbfC family nucleoid-associated protein n=1 Tax=Streptomyces mirabilis TaxID=68239 RepID=UPI003692164C